MLHFYCLAYRIIVKSSTDNVFINCVLFDRSLNINGIDAFPSRSTFIWNIISHINHENVSDASEKLKFDANDLFKFRSRVKLSPCCYDLIDPNEWAVTVDEKKGDKIALFAFRFCTCVRSPRDIFISFYMKTYDNTTYGVQQHNKYAPIQSQRYL